MEAIRTYKRKRKIPWLLLLPLGLYALISLYPMIYLLLYSLKTTDEIFYTNPFGIPLHPQFGNYVRAVKSFDIITFFSNSAVITCISVAAILLLALPFSYAVSRMQWKWKNRVYNYLTLGLFIPVQVVIIPLAILIRDLQLANTKMALIVPYIAFHLSFTCMVLCNSFLTLPKELEESAFIDGAGVITAFGRIMVPLVKPAVATAMIFAMMNIWNEYTLASILAASNRVKTLPIGLAAFVGQRSTDWGAMGACMVLASIPTIVLYLACSEQVENALTVSGAVKG